MTNPRYSLSASAKLGKNLARLRKSVGISAVGSRATIYGRIKLLSLSEKVKEALRAGKITPQVALLIARIPNPKVAEEAAARILKGDEYGQPFAFRQVQAFITREYMTQLKGAHQTEKGRQSEGVL